MGNDRPWTWVFQYFNQFSLVVKKLAEHVKQRKGLSLGGDMPSRHLLSALRHSNLLAEHVKQRKGLSS
jgi:hypothetical protein